MKAVSIPMQKVQSSNIDSIGHDGAANELHVRFKNGTTYAYQGVHRALYQNMLAAPSAGNYHAETIRNVFQHRKL